MTLYLAQNMKTLMKRSQIDLRNLSKKTSIPYSTLHTWLHQGTPGDVNKLKTLANHFQVSLDRLLYESLQNTSEWKDSSPDGKEARTDPKKCPRKWILRVIVEEGESF